MEDEKLPVTDHLEELRWRIIKCFIAVIAGFLISFTFSQQIFDLLTYPLVKAMPQGENSSIHHCRRPLSPT